MKTILTALFIAICGFASAQLNISYKKHALQSDDKNVTQSVEYVSPGKAGNSVVWDFTHLTCIGARTSLLTESFNTPKGESQSNTNISVQENDNYFYFNVNPHGIFFHGFVTPDATIHYYSPIQKMAYPFKYGDRLEGHFTGEGLYYGSVQTQIDGNYSVEADAFGTLLLPENVTVENVLRVKTVEKYIEAACNSTEIEQIKYLWFSADSRYPVFVSMETIKTPANEAPIITKGSYYNSKAVTEKIISQKKNIQNNPDFDILCVLKPNPVRDMLEISYTLNRESMVSIEIIEASGVKIGDVVQQESQNGENSRIINLEQYQLATGNYFIRIYIDGRPFFKPFQKIN